MTFAETLEAARGGDRAAYDILCNAALNEMYAAAVLVLGRKDAPDAVRKAFDSAESGVARIKTFDHFKAWLARTLARVMVAKLKENKAAGIVPAGEGAVAAALSLPDVERLVFALSAAGGYKQHEISVILGIPEDTVPARLSSAEKRLGSHAESVRAFVVTCRAPEALRRGGTEQPYAPEVQIQFAPGDTQTMEIAPKQTWSEVPEAPEPEPPAPEAGLNAETFINVVAKEHIKGGEFLRLLGNTRISNAAYREIEQNPELTKSRLIELLESSQLDENDYYKLLSAVKQRREIIEAKEGSRAMLEQAGLFDGYRPKRDSEHLMQKEEKSDLARAIEIEAAEARRREEERQKADEKRRKAEEEARRLEEERQKAEAEARRLEEERRKAEAEARRLEEEQRRAEEEARRLEEEQRRAEEARRIEEEQRRAEEARRIEEERRRAEEARRLEEEQRRAEEARRIEEEQRRAEEARRIEEEQRRAAEARRIEEEQRRAEEEARRIEEEQRRAEEARRIEEEQRRAEEEARREQERKAAEEEARRIETERLISTHEFSAEPEELGLPAENNDPIGDPDGEISGMTLSRKPEHQTQSILFKTDKGSKSRKKDRSADEKPFRPTVYDTYNIDKIREDGGGFIIPPHRSSIRRPEPKKAAPRQAPKQTAKKEAPEPERKAPEKAPEKIPEAAPAKAPARVTPNTEPNREYGAAPVIPAQLPEAPDAKRANDDFYDEPPAKKKGNPAVVIIIIVLILAAAGVGFMFARDKGLFGGKTSIAETLSSEPIQMTSDGEVYAATAERAQRKTFFTPIYMRSDGKPYESALASDIIRLDGAVLIRGRNGIDEVTLGSSPAARKLPLSDRSESDFIGFTSDSENIYVLYRADGNSAVDVLIYERGGMKLLHTYKQSGSYRAFSAENGSLALVTNYTPSSPSADKPESFLPAQTLDGDTKLISCTDIELISDTSYNGSAVLGTLNGEKTSAFVTLGFYDCFARFDENGCVILAADKNRTVAMDYAKSGGAYSLKERRTFDGEAFSPDCLGGSAFVGFDTLDGTIVVQNGNDKVYCGIENELPSGISFTNDGRVYVVTSADSGTSKLYGFDLSGGGILPDDNISADRVYMDKLIKCGDKLLGIRSETDENGEPSQFRLTLRSYGDKLAEESSAVVGVDSKTSAQYAKYLSCAAVSCIDNIAVSEDGSRAAVAVKYFDGISDIMRVVLFGTDDGLLTEIGDLLLFDTNSEYCCTAIEGDVLYILTESRIITADTDDCKPTGYFADQ